MRQIQFLIKIKKKYKYIFFFVAILLYKGECMLILSKTYLAHISDFLTPQQYSNLHSMHRCSERLSTIHHYTWNNRSFIQFPQRRNHKNFCWGLKENDKFKRFKKNILIFFEKNYKILKIAAFDRKMALVSDVRECSAVQCSAVQYEHLIKT